MKRLVDFITEKAMGKDDFLSYQAWEALTVTSNPDEQMAIIIAYVKNLYMHAKYSKEAFNSHMEHCHMTQVIRLN